MLTCQELVELVTEYLDGAMSPSARRDLESHLLDCPDCRSYLAQLSATRELLGRIPPDSLDPDTCSELVEVFRRAREGAADA